MDLSLLMVVNHQAICLLERTGKGLESPAPYPLAGALCQDRFTPWPCWIPARNRPDCPLAADGAQNHWGLGPVPTPFPAALPLQPA